MGKTLVAAKKNSNEDLIVRHGSTLRLVPRAHQSPTELTNLKPENKPARFLKPGRFSGKFWKLLNSHS